MSQSKCYRRIVAVIPARLASTRLPRKVLLPLAGRPMLAWVYEAAHACPELAHPDAVLIATDSEEIAALCRQQRWPVLLTSPQLASGSDRVHAAALQLEAEGRAADIYVNLQADEPLLLPEHLTALLRPFRDPAAQVSTLKVLCPEEELDDPNTVKVVTSPDQRGLYFSRATIPHQRDPGQHGVAVWKHLGLYAYTADALHRFHGLAPSPLELTEKLEQLRFLEHGISIHVEPVERDTIGVDTEQDRQRAEQLLLARMEGTTRP